MCRFVLFQELDNAITCYYFQTVLLCLSLPQNTYSEVPQSQSVIKSFGRTSEKEVIILQVKPPQNKTHISEIARQPLQAQICSQLKWRDVASECLPHQCSSWTADNKIWSDRKFPRWVKCRWLHYRWGRHWSNQQASNSILECVRGCVWVQVSEREVSKRMHCKHV